MNTYIHFQYITIFHIKLYFPEKKKKKKKKVLKLERTENCN